ncbi:MAG TPA: serine/threonine-protein kinase, partial [Thermoanaerobaculia bacterium]|nr:serine/threonine-protein kinase [Thermoanaerobaculia bacterium]
MRYRTAVPLAQGGTADVFKAYDEQLGRHVALKFLRRDDPALLERLLREARAQARLDHPNICRVYDVGERDGVPFIAMQLIDGQTLGEAAGGMTLEEKVRVLRDVAEAVHTAHREGLVHRDIKPGNVMVERHEEGRLVPYVLDFGLVRDVSAPGLTHTGLVMGTPSYMAPEQARGEATGLDRRTDVYGLGATLYTILTGRPPFEGTTTEVLLQVLDEEPVPPRKHDPSLPRDLQDITLKCLEKEAERRYGSARELADELDRWLQGMPVLARAPSVAYRMRRRLRRHRTLAAVTASGLIVAAALGGWVAVERWRAVRGAEAAQLLGQEVRDIEWQLRVAQMAPRHDLTADRQRIRERLADIEATARAAGSAGSAAGEYALGRGLLVLDETDAAAEHLDRAWRLGLRTPELAFARGVALGRQYWREALRAKAVRDPGERQRRLAEAQQRWRDPALTALVAVADSRSSAVAPLPYVEALIAFYEERWDDALAGVAATLAAAPWFWEAHQLAGDVHRHRAGELYEASRFAEGAAALEAAEASFAAATALAPSAAEPWKGACGTRVYGLFRAMVASLPAEEFERRREAALAACEALGQIRPDHPELPLHQANTHLMTARWRYARGGDPRPELAQGLERAERAVDLNPESGAAFRSLADLTLELAKVTTQRGEDAGELLDRAAALFDQAFVFDPTTGAANGAGNAYFFKFREDIRSGRDPLPAMQRAEEYYRRAGERSPDNVLLMGNVALVMRERASWEGEHGVDPRPRLAEVVRLLEEQEAKAPEYHFLPVTLAFAELERARAEARHGGDPLPALAAARNAAERGVAAREDAYEPWLAATRVEVEIVRRRVAAGEDPQPDLPRARRALERYLALQPEQAEGYEERARLAAALGRRALAGGDDAAPHLAAGLADVDRAL